MVEQSLETGSQSPDFTVLNDYVDWVTQNWIHELGTDEAQQHVRSKLTEETHELCEALETGNPDEILLELGDVLWTAHACALNEGFSVTSSSVPTSSIDGGAKSKDITWDVPALYALSGGDPEDVTVLIQSGDLETTQLVLSTLSGRLGKASRLARALQPAEQPETRDQSDYTGVWQALYYGRVTTSLSQMTLLVSLIAQHHLGVGLEQVMQANHRKISERLAKGEPVTR